MAVSATAFPFLLKCIIPPLFLIEWIRRLIHHTLISHQGPLYGRACRKILPPFLDKIRQHLASYNSPVTVLEFGAGPFPNLDILPDGSHMIVCEPCPDFYSDLEKVWNQSDLKRSGGKFTLLDCKIEEITSRHIPESSVDLVLSKMVNCSVGDNKKAFKNIFIALKPNGRYYFWDHVRADNWAVKMIQYIMSLPVLVFFTDCNPSRRAYTLLKPVGFSEVNVDVFIAPLKGWLYFIYKTTAAGYAVKAP